MIIKCLSEMIKLYCSFTIQHSSVPFLLSSFLFTKRYVISELARARKLDAAKAMTLGAKGHALGQLKQGLDVVLPDGTSIRAQDVLSLFFVYKVNEKH